MPESFGQAFVLAIHGSVGGRCPVLTTVAAERPRRQVFGQIVSDGRDLQWETPLVRGPVRVQCGQS